MMHLLDVNVLLALAWPNHVHHRPARDWFATHSDEGWATSSVTESGFVRVSSNFRVTPDARPPAEAATILRRICALGMHKFLRDDVSLALHANTLGAVVHSSAQVTDVHLLLLAQTSGSSFVTFDRGASAIADALEVPHTLLSI